MIDVKKLDSRISLTSNDLIHGFIIRPKDLAQNQLAIMETLKQIAEALNKQELKQGNDE